LGGTPAVAHEIGLLLLNIGSFAQQLRRSLRFRLRCDRTSGRVPTRDGLTEPQSCLRHRRYGEILLQWVRRWPCDPLEARAFVHRQRLVDDLAFHRAVSCNSTRVTRMNPGRIATNDGLLRDDDACNGSVLSHDQLHAADVATQAAIDLNVAVAPQIATEPHRAIKHGSGLVQVRACYRTRGWLGVRMKLLLRRLLANWRGLS
jgi:hypothetical protein